LWRNSGRSIGAEYGFMGFYQFPVNPCCEYGFCGNRTLRVADLRMGRGCNDRRRLGGDPPSPSLPTSPYGLRRTRWRAGVSPYLLRWQLRGSATLREMVQV